MTLPLPCCLLTLDLIGPGLQSFIFALGFFLIVTENVTPRVCACMYCVCVCFVFDLGIFCTKRKLTGGSPRGEAELSYGIRCILWELGKLFFVFFS